MRRLTLALLLLAFAAVPAAADAATVHVVRGGGFGHGVGLSQYGAYGYAKNGRGYEAILKHYFQGTELSRASSRPARVLLAASRSTIRFRGVSRIGPRTARPSATYTARRRGSKVVVYSGRRRVGTFSRVSVYRPRKVTRLLGRAMTGVTSGRYRGKLVLRPGSSGGVTVVNELDLDSYVKGVVAAEMPSSWHPEALKAQAVAARSYARASSPRSRVFDHYPDTRSQVYRGVAGERRSTSRAVKATARQVVTYRGDVIVTYFFSTSGGHTENVENIFGGDPRPYLVGVTDRFDDISPRHRWSRRFSSSSLDSRLGAPGSYRGLRVLRRGVSPRIIRAQVLGSSGSRRLTGPQLRSRLGTYDVPSSFTTVTSAQARLARVAGPGPSARKPQLVGRFSPAPSSRRVVVERRVGRRWKRVARARLSKAGAFRVSLRRGGVYRARAAGLTGPATRIR
jgi:stage II sporulation protein D